jgi:hypothetical protein
VSDLESRLELYKHQAFKAISQGIINIITKEIPKMQAALSDKQVKDEVIKGRVEGTMMVDEKDIKEIKDKVESIKNQLKSGENIKKAI